MGTFNTMWCKWVEVAADRDGGVGGPRCAKLAQMYADALDAKKHLLMPQASHEMKVGDDVHDNEVPSCKSSLGRCSRVHRCTRPFPVDLPQILTPWLTSFDLLAYRR